MTRASRAAPPGYVYHVLNRAVARLPLFQKDGDYDAFERVLSEALQAHPTRLLGYCLMPNHWHFVVWPQQEGELTAFAQWLTHTHTMRWHTHYHTLGSGHVYQGRFKSFRVQEDEHFYQVVRYVERNALRANLVQRAEDWRWSSLWRRQHPDAKPLIPLADWPLSLPSDWLEIVNRPQTAVELEAVRRSVNRDAPFGNLEWQRATAACYNWRTLSGHAADPGNGPRHLPLSTSDRKNEACPLFCPHAVRLAVRSRHPKTQGWQAGSALGSATPTQVPNNPVETTGSPKFSGNPYCPFATFFDPGRTARP